MDLTDLIEVAAVMRMKAEIANKKEYDEAVDQHCNQQAETIFYLAQLVEDAISCIECGPSQPEKEAEKIRNRLKVILKDSK